MIEALLEAIETMMRVVVAIGIGINMIVLEGTTTVSIGSVGNTATVTATAGMIGVGKTPGTQGNALEAQVKMDGNGNCVLVF